MSTANETMLEDRPARSWKRRGLFAAAWAAVAGLVLKTTARNVEAATALPVNYSSDDPNTQFLSFTTSPIYVSSSSNIVTSPFGHHVLSVQADWTGSDAMHATSASAYAISAQSNAGAVTILGQIPGTSSTNAIAIYGVNASSYQGTVPGTGGWGVVGISRYGHGVLGATSALGAGAVVGATNGIAGAYAGIFFGPAIVEGNFTVVGGAKSAAVPHPDGTHRRLYCLESPESWFEDFGEAALECGEATIAFDEDFAAVTDSTAYQVFLTQYGGHDDLSVTERTARGFRVEAKDPTSANRFGWRVVAKRKDIAAPRFETVTVPTAPAMPSVPEPLSTEARSVTRSGVRHR